MNKYVFILEKEYSVRIFVEAENTTGAWLELAEKLRYLYHHKNISLPQAAHNWVLIQ